MASFETGVIHYIFEGAGIVIGAAYFFIFCIIVQGILQQKKRTGGPTSKLAIMMAAIFISCSLSHFIHIFFLHSNFESFASNITNLYVLTAVDVGTAAIAVIFLSIRKSYGIVIAGPHALVEAKDKLHVRNEQLHVLSQIMATADDTLDLNEMTRNVLSKSSSLLGMSGGAIYLVNRNNPFVLKLATCSNPLLFDEEIAVKPSSKDPASDIDVIASVMSTAKLFIAENKNDVAKTNLNKLIQMQSLIVVPLKKNELVGVFLLYDNKPRTFISEEINFLEAMGSQIGNAIEKATLYKESVESRRQAELLTDLLSHDIRNFNQITSGFLQMLMKDKSLPDNLKNMAKIASDANRGSSNIIANVKKLGKLQNSDESLFPLNVIERIKKAEDTVEQVYTNEKDSIDISIKFDGNEQDYMVVADEFIDDVFLNLLGNAVKYDKNTDCHIDISVEKQTGKDDDTISGDNNKKSFIVISIADNGRGIPDDKKPLIFDRFTTTSHGSGLGLSICKAIVVNRYNGKIWVENRIKEDYTKGSVFKVLIPMPIAHAVIGKQSIVK